MRYRILNVLILTWVVATAGCQGMRSGIDPTGERLFVDSSGEYCPPACPEPACPEPAYPAAKKGLAATLSSSATVAPVGSQVILVAGALADEGHYVTNRRVEWSLEPSGVGHFVAVGKREWNAWLFLDFNNPSKIDNTYAVGSTVRSQVTLDRGTPSSADDVCVVPGQTWISLTSPVAGTSHVSAYVPQADASRVRRRITVQWIDAVCQFPPPAITPAGQRSTLTTTVTGATSQSPRAGWTVRYTIADGPPAGFAPDGNQSVDVATDASGRACAEIYQTQPGAGTNRITIEVIRPAHLDRLGNAPLVVGSGSTLQTWTSADLSIRIMGPATAAVGSTLTYAIEVSNPGDLPTENAVVTDDLPAGLTYVDSTPAAEQFGGQLRWQVGTLAAGQRTTLEVRCRATRSGDVEHCAQATADGGLSDRHCVSTNVSDTNIQMTMTGPKQAAVGSNVTFQIMVKNIGQSDTPKLLLKDRFDVGLESSEPRQVIARTLNPLSPGQSIPIDVMFRVTKEGRLWNRAELSDEQRVLATAEEFVTGVASTTTPRPGQAALTVETWLTTGSRTVVGDVAKFKILVTNRSQQTLTNVTVVATYDDQMTADLATTGFQATGRRLTWTIPSLPPGSAEPFDVHCLCDRAISKTCNRVSVTCDQGLTGQDEACLEIVAAGTGSTGPTPGSTPGTDPGAVDLSGLTVAVRALTEGQVVQHAGLTYNVVVSNQGTATQTNITVRALLPEGLSPDPNGILTTGPTSAKISGQMINFAPLPELRPGESKPYYVRVLTPQVGDYVFEASIHADGLTKSISAETETRVVQSPDPATTP